MRTNLIVGDMLNGKEKVFFVEYTTPIKGKFKRKVFSLVDMENGVEKVIQDFPIVNYDELEPIEIYGELIPEPDENPPGEAKKLAQESLF